MRRRRKALSHGFGVREKWEAPTVDCSACGETMEAARLYEVRGRSGEVVVILRSVPCHLCADPSHPRALSSNDFRTKLHEALFDGRFPATRRRRFGRVSCWECGQRLKDSPPIMDEVQGEVEVDGAKIMVILTAPRADCPSCGRAQFKAETAATDHVKAAVDAALVRGKLPV